MHHGRSLRVVHVLRRLRDMGCAIEAVTPSAELAEKLAATIPGIEVVTPSAAAPAPPPRRKLRERTFDFMGWDRAMAAEVVARTPRATAVLGFDFVSVPYLHVARQYPDASAHVLLDGIDDPRLTAKSAKLRDRLRLPALKTAVANRVLVKSIIRQFDTLVVVAPQDAKSLGKSIGREVLVIPNGVEAPNRPPASEREELVVLTGAMDFPPNATAALHIARKIWPLVREERPSARLAIVGSRPGDEVRSLASIDGVDVEGHVESVWEWLGRARIATAPMMSGSGIKNKILEACSAGCPVVATSLGAGGIASGEDHGILLANTPESFARTLVSLLASPERAARIGEAGRTHVRTHYTWESVAARFLECLQRPRREGTSAPV